MFEVLEVYKITWYSNNWNVGGELAYFSDVFWNTESICKSLKKKKVAKVIAMAIAEFAKEQEGT